MLQEQREQQVLQEQREQQVLQEQREQQVLHVQAQRGPQEQKAQQDQWEQYASPQTSLWELGARSGDNLLKATHIIGHIRYEDGTFENVMFDQSPYSGDIDLRFKYECEVCNSRFNTMFCKVNCVMNRRHHRIQIRL